MRRPRFVSAECPSCGTLHACVPIEWDEDGEGTPDLDTVPCGDDECRVKLCASCPQFTCDGCGLKHCLEHKINFADLKLCPVCMEQTKEQAPEPEEDPRCECVFCGDTADNRGCPAHGPHSPAARRIRMEEAAAEVAYWSTINV